VVHHHPVAHRQPGRGAGAQLRDDAARLVAGDGVDGHGTTVPVKIGAAHARGADLHHSLAGSRMGVRELTYLALSVAVEHHAAHGRSPVSRNFSTARNTGSGGKATARRRERLFPFRRLC